MKSLVLLLALLLATGAAFGQGRTNQTAKLPGTGANNKPKLTDAQRKQAAELHKQIKEALDAKKFADAKAKLEELLKLVPDSPFNLYNLACAQAQLGEKAEAVATLEKAVEKGWADFTHLERDPDLESLRKEKRYKDLIARRAEIQRERAEKINTELTKQHGKDCLHYIDDEHRLVFATTVDQRTLDELREMLEGYATALGKMLFQHRPERYVTVVIPKVWRGGMIAGLYNDTEATLLSRGIGDTMIHEFTHAMHHADQYGRDQQHPIWLTEGLATLFENSDLENGVAVPRHNHRLNYILTRVRINRQVPFAKFAAMKQPDFMRWPNYNYAQARYMMFYLYETGKLRRWYENYVTNYASDTNGLSAWEKTYGKPVAEVEKDWAAWVQTLSEQPIRLKEGDPCLGVSLRPSSDGIMITYVEPGTGAAKAGLKIQDLITRVAGRRVVSGEDLIEALSKHKNGDKVTVEYRRAKEYSEIQVELTPAPSPYKQRPAAKPPAPKAAPTEKPAAKK